MICFKCKNDKPLDDFKISKVNKSGYYSYCNECSSEYKRSKYKENPKKRLAMNKLKQLILEEVGIYENKQLADKLYFNTGKLSQEDKNFIYNITRGDNTTKIISDIYFTLKDSWYNKEMQRELPKIHNQLMNYNTNVFPIKDFDGLNSKNLNNIYNILIDRQMIIDNIKQLPSIAIRNMKADIRIPRDYSQMSKYTENLNYFMGIYSLLGNRDDKLKEKIHNKMFKSNITLDDLLDFTREKENLLGGKEFTKQDIIDLIDEDSEDMSIIYDKNNVIVVKVESAEAIKAIGCNSFWCFTYGENNYRNWNEYSYNGVVYVIIDFKLPSDDQEFMHVLIKPLKSEKFYNNEDNEHEIPLFNMANDNWYNPYSVLRSLLGNNFKKLFNFDY